MSRYCLDTVAYAQFRAGERRVSALLDAAEWIGIPVIVLGELHALGATAGLRDFLSSPVVEVLPVDAETAALFGEIVAGLRRQKRPFPTNSLWVAASCIKASATLLTWNVEYHAIPRLEFLVLADVRVDSARPN